MNILKNVLTIGSFKFFKLNFTRCSLNAFDVLCLQNDYKNKVSSKVSMCNAKSLSMVEVRAETAPRVCVGLSEIGRCTVHQCAWVPAQPPCVCGLSRRSPFPRRTAPTLHPRHPTSQFAVTSSQLMNTFFLSII